jgi:hypothetical protein
MELMIATTISIMVMGATVTLFGVVGDKINAGRAMIETNDRLRSTQNLLRRDLRGATVSFLPWEQPSAGSGFFEIVKGPAATNRDSNDVKLNAPSAMIGYTQDYLMFTTRSPDLPFTGRFTPGGSPRTIESQVAEVIWYVQPTLNAAGIATNPPTYTLYRRQFLVLPTILTDTGTTPPPATYFENNDVSAHLVSGQVVANSLADLTYRENRFAHVPSPAPYLINNPAGLKPFQPPYLPNGAPNPIGSQRYGEDVVLTNVLSFDVKVWDPGAEVRFDPAHQNTPLVPSDPGWTGGTKFNPPQYGAYVDLNYNSGVRITNPASAPPTYFAGPDYGNGNSKFGSTFGLTVSNSTKNYATFDTWSLGYEYWNSAISSSQSANQAFDGFDDGGSGVSGKYGVDNPNERMTCPPYPVPLRGVQVKIRVYEPTSRQVREITVAETFLPD